MKTLIEACLTVAFLGFCATALASPTIELKDGSRIEGEIQGIDHGVYTVLSTSLGTLHVAQSNIARIVYSDDRSAPSSDSSAKAPAHDDAVSGEIQQLQEHLAKDPEAMKSVMSLQSDPQIQAVLNDPAIVKAIQNGDYMSLLGNAKIQALENDEHLKQVMQQVP